MKLIISLLGLLIITVFWSFFYQNNFLAKTVQPSYEITTGSTTLPPKGSTQAVASSWIAISLRDGLQELKASNPQFQDAVKMSENKEYSGAIDLLKKTKEAVTSSGEKAIIDFNISSNNFALDRLAGVKSFLELAKNEQNPVRTRALAMQRIFLMYKKYNDESVLRAIAQEMWIEWTTPEAVELAYVKAGYALFPFPSFAVYLMYEDVKKAKDKDEALKIYQKYKSEIDPGIKLQQSFPGEQAEVTSTMLSMVNMQARLHTEYDKSVSREEVEASYRALVEYDQKKWLTTNKQWTLLYYGEFLAKIGDVENAEKTLLILITDWLESSLLEALPKSKVFLSIKGMSGIKDPRTQELMKFIWSTKK